MATNEKQVLEDMVKIMTQLTETNQILSKTNTGLSHQLTVLQKWKIPGGLMGPVKPGGGWGGCSEAARQVEESVPQLQAGGLASSHRLF